MFDVHVAQFVVFTTTTTYVGESERGQGRISISFPYAPLPLFSLLISRYFFQAFSLKVLNFSYFPIISLTMALNRDCGTRVDSICVWHRKERKNGNENCRQQQVAVYQFFHCSSSVLSPEATLKQWQEPLLEHSRQESRKTMTCRGTLKKIMRNKNGPVHCRRFVPRFVGRARTRNVVWDDTMNILIIFIFYIQLTRVLFSSWSVDTHTLCSCYLSGFYKLIPRRRLVLCNHNTQHVCWWWWMREGRRWRAGTQVRILRGRNKQCDEPEC